MTMTKSGEAVTKTNEIRELDLKGLEAVNGGVNSIQYVEALTNYSASESTEKSQLRAK